MTDHNYPMNEVLDEVNKLLESGNVNVYQKFTCAGCKNRLTIEQPNTFYTSGKCDACGHVTNIQKDGCNFLVIARVGFGNPEPRDV